MASDKLKINIELNSERVHSCPNENSVLSKKFKGSKTKNKLPKDFHKTLVELENQFYRTKDNETMQEILFFYKVKLNNLDCCRILLREG